MADKTKEIELQEYSELLKLREMFNTPGWPIFEAEINRARNAMLVSIGGTHGEDCQRSIGALTAMDALSNFVEYAKTAEAPKREETEPGTEIKFGPDMDKSINEKER